VDRDEDCFVGIFAHNEEQHIISCLNSLSPDLQNRGTKIFVLANGCTDNTEAIVIAYAESHPYVHLTRIPLGDKANAWNHFVHAIRPSSKMIFFMDGDVEVLPGALSALAEQLSAHPYANAISALPATGRSGRTRLGEGETEHGIWGGLYCLRGSFITRLQEMNIRIPVGLVGDDGLIGALVMWDLETRRPWDRRRIAANLNPNARFRFTPLSPLNPRHVRLYYRRLIRYSIRRYQNKMIGWVLKEGGIGSMPAHVVELYKKYPDACRLELRGASTWFDWLALRQMRAQLKSLAMV
jgi:glycosyltransferase involved in cell wall biosynthesis